uniref:Uncharacterized protein n=1 Tax=Oryza brachyantha TaxID=4533 RepID=J3MYT8_ORYBR
MHGAESSASARRRHFSAASACYRRFTAASASANDAAQTPSPLLPPTPLSWPLHCFVKDLNRPSRNSKETINGGVPKTKQLNEPTAMWASNEATTLTQ